MGSACEPKETFYFKILLLIKLSTLEEVNVLTQYCNLLQSKVKEKTDTG